jgi:hypothetical protein
MNDYLEILNNYKDVKDVFDLVDDVQKLRFYYSTQQYQTMMQHIRDLVAKYPIDAGVWNLFHPNMPKTYEEAYASAEIFLRGKGFGILLQKGYDLSQYLKQEDINSIQQMNKPMD